MKSIKFHIVCLLFIGLILLPNAGLAQDVAISGAIKLNSKLSNFKVLGKTGNRFVVERYGDDQHVLDVYNSYLKLQSSKPLPLEKDEVLAKIWLQPKNSWMLSLRHGKDKSYLEKTAIDDKLAFNSKSTIIDSIYERKDLLESNIRTELSLNESKLMIYFPVFNQGKVDYFYTMVLNHEMKVLQQLKIKEALLIDKSFVDAFVLNDGSCVFITNNKDNSEVFYFTLITNDGSIKTHSYYPTKNVYKKLKFEVDNIDNAIFIAGFFGQANVNKKDNYGASEFFLSKFSLDNFSNIFTHTQSFSDKFYTDLTGKNSELNPPQLFTFYVNSIIPRMDGGASVIAESYFKTEEQETNNAYFSISGTNSYYNTITFYNYNDLLIFPIDSTGKAEDYKIVRKKQVSEDDNGSYSSFFLLNVQNDLKAIFLDEITSGAHLSEASLHPNNISKTNTLFNLGSKNVYPIVKMGKQTAPNEMIIPSFYRNRLQIIKISF